MKRLINKISGLCFIPLFLVCAACSPDDYMTIYRGGPEFEGERVRVRLSLSGAVSDGTKVSLLDKSEGRFSGAEVFVFYADNGMMDSVQEIPASSFDASTRTAEATLSFPAGRPVRVYVSGNLWAIDKDAGTRSGLGQALNADFPLSESEFESFVYRFDGSPLNAEYRFERMAEVAAFGIPFAGKVPAATYTEASSLKVGCTRLFAKISLTINHGNLDGDGANPEYFKNSRLFLRQANIRLNPFSESGSCALVSADVSDGDYDSSMANASSMRFDFYVPENLQGTLLPGNTDQRRKSRDELVAAVGAAKESLLTYVEFCGEVSSAAGGYGGPVVYRFYLGNDNCSNFDVRRGRCYDIDLSFEVSSLFDPHWQVDPDFTDNRELGISADAAFASDLPEGQMVAVRPGREGRLYVYVRAGDGGTKRRPDGIADTGYKPSSLADCRISTSFLASDGSVISPELSALGITPYFDASTGLLRLKVTDPALFRTGRSVDLRLTVEPRGESFDFTVRTYEDISVSWDKSITEGFYPGMSRTATLTGFCGEVGVACTDAHMFKHNRTAGNGNLLTNDYNTSPRLSNGSFSIYNYYYCNDAEYRIMFRPDDSFNDGDVLSLPIKNTMPDIRLKGLASDFAPGTVPVAAWAGKKAVYLDITGAPWLLPLSVELYAPGGTVPLDYSDFDETVFAHVYTPQLKVGDSVSQVIDGETVYTGDDESYVALSRRQGTEGFPQYDIYRCRIGDCFDTYATDDVRMRNCRFMFMPTVSSYYGSGFFRTTRYADIYLRPFLSENLSVNIAPRYDDYTMWKGNGLDEKYRNLAFSSAEGNGLGGRIGFNVQDASMMELYATPLSKDSYDGGGKSGSFIVEAEKMDGPAGVAGQYKALSLRFADDGTNRHSAGPHEIRVSVTNRHSRETRSVTLGRTEVFVHFIVGADYDRSASFYDVHGSRIYVVPRIISDIGRTSFGDSRYNIELVKSVKMAQSKTGYSGLLQPPGVGAAYTFPLTPEPGTGEAYAYPAGIGTVMPICIYTVSADGSGQETVALADFFNAGILTRQPAAEYLRSLALALPSNILNMKFANPGYGSSGGSKYLDTLDITGFGDLRYGGSGSDKGYYVFHLLSDLSSASLGWIPYMEALCP